MSQSGAVGCGVLQCVAVCLQYVCSVFTAGLQPVAVLQCCSVVRCGLVWFSIVQNVAIFCRVLPCVAACCLVFPRVAACYSVLQ